MVGMAELGGLDKEKLEEELEIAWKTEKIE